jgi:RHS repeat-associated protein
LEERVRDGSGAIPATADTRFVWSPVYVDAMIARDKNADSASGTGTGGLEQRIYALQDANWNTTAIIAASGVLGFATGNVVYRFVYSPYGVSQTLDASWTTAASPLVTNWTHLFQGLKFTESTGLAYVRNRDYSANLGRFIERDPIGFDAGDNNWYRFVGNQPAFLTDPSGLIEVGPPHNPGGPLEPPATGLTCKGTDTCTTLIEKVMIFRTIIESHKRWDREHPDPRWPGGRHLDEIIDFEKGLRKCYTFYGKKCPEPDCPPAPAPAPVPAPTPTPTPPVIVVPPVVPSIPTTPPPAPRPWFPRFGFPLGPVLIIPAWPTGPNGEELA